LGKPGRHVLVEKRGKVFWKEKKKGTLQLNAKGGSIEYEDGDLFDGAIKTRINTKGEPKARGGVLWKQKKSK